MRGVRTWAVAVPQAGARPARRRGRAARPERGRRAARSRSRPPASSRSSSATAGCACRSSAASSRSASRSSSASRRSASPRTRRCPRRRSRSPAALDRTIVFSLVLAVGLFFVVPVALTNLIKDELGSAVLFWIVERHPAHRDLPRLPAGCSRACATCAACSSTTAPSTRRSPATRPACELTPENAQRFSRLHPRCGTSFLLIVMVVAIFVFAPLGLPAWYWLLVLTRIVGVPLIAGISFEIIKLAGKHRSKRWVQIADVARAPAPAAHHARARPRRSSPSRSPRWRPCSSARPPARSPTRTSSASRSPRSSRISCA